MDSFVSFPVFFYLRMEGKSTLGVGFSGELPGGGVGSILF